MTKNIQITLIEKDIKQLIAERYNLDPLKTEILVGYGGGDGRFPPTLTITVTGPEKQCVLGFEGR